MYRSDLPPFILDFPWRKFRSRKGTPFRDYFASTIRDNLTKELRNSFRGTSAPEETATAFFFHGLFFPRPHLHRTRSLSSATDVDLLRKIESRSRLFKLAYRNICNGITIIRINRKHRVDLIDLYGSRL